MAIASESAAQASVSKEAPGVGAQGGRRSTGALILEGARPRQWSKNAFVLAGVVFSGRALEFRAEWRGWLMFLAFCLVSGATYLINDVADAETDRLSRRTASRPIARGDLAPRTALAAAAAAVLLAVGLTALLSWEALLALVGFCLLQIGYSGGLKHVLFVDVMIIAGGFVLRALAGLLAIGAILSPWLLLATGLLALFLGLAKRRGEVVALGDSPPTARPVLEHYSVGLLDELIAVITPTTVMVYALYGVLGARSEAILLTLPFVLYGIFRVLFLIHHRPGTTEDPAVIVWRDRPLLFCVAGWALAAGAISVIAYAT